MFKLKLTKKKILSAGGVLVLGVFTCGALLVTAALSAGSLFNLNMAKQNFFNGTITCQALFPTLTGNVYFRNLLLEHNGERVLLVPQGRIKLSVWDIITRNISADSVKELELKDINLQLRFNDKMEPDFLPAGAKTPQSNPMVPKFNGPKLLNLNFTLPNTKLILNDAVIAAYYQNRAFILNRADCIITVQHHNHLMLNLSCNNFGGTMEGKGCNLSGSINVYDDKPDTAHLNLGLYDVVPKSLGLGDLKDPLTITGELTGDLAKPEINGAISMHVLKLPNLIFYDLGGNYIYKSGVATFKDVTAKFCDGNVSAYGLYNIDKRSYQIHAVGEGVNVADAVKHSNIHAKANVEIDFYATSNPKDSLIMGTVATGKGSYKIFSFKSISCDITNQNGNLDLRNVKLDTDLGTVTTDYVRTRDKKLHFADIYIDAQGKKHLILNSK